MRLFRAIFWCSLLAAGIGLTAAKYYNHPDITRFTLNPGTGFATEVIIADSGQEGNNVLLVAGIHGNEPAGVMAVEELVSRLRPVRGKVVAIPVANPPAWEAGLRFAPGEQDLNRAFSCCDQSPTGGQARAILALIREQGIDWIIDLHESEDFYRRDESRVGQTIIFPASPRAAALVLDVLEEINRELEPQLHFSCLSPPAAGSLVQSAWEEWGIPGFIIETSKKQDLEKRVDQHLLVLNRLLTRLEVVK